MAVVKPVRGQADWDVPLNAALDGIDARVVKLETITNGAKASNSTGAKGEMAYDTTYLYICVATNTWIRVARVAW